MEEKFTKKQKIFTLFVLLILLSSIISISTVIASSNQWMVNGFVYLDNKMALPDEVILTLPTRDYNSILFLSGRYAIYFNEEPAYLLNDDGSNNGIKITNVTTQEDGSSYYNCATCKGAGGVRAYYPGTENPQGGMEPNFPSNPVHKLINETSLQSLSSCYQVARGWVRTHNVVPIKISTSFVPTRYDFFPGQLIEIDSSKYKAYGKYVLRDFDWNYSLMAYWSFEYYNSKEHIC